MLTSQQKEDICYKQTHCEGDNRCIVSLQLSKYCIWGGEHSEDKSISMAILRHASKHDEII
jgi:hypothetical protein